MQIPAHRSFFRCLSLLGLVSLAVQLPAAEEPEGWSIRCARGADMPELSELPRLSLRPLPTVVTNGSAPCRIRVTDGTRTASGFQYQLPIVGSARIRELARGLGHDWRKCYYFVRDNIAFTPAPGFMRGPERTLLDREGSDADQALLLHALLEECGVQSKILYAPPMPAGETGAAAFAVPMVSHAGRFDYTAASWLSEEQMGITAVCNCINTVLHNAGRSFNVFTYDDGTGNVYDYLP